MDTGVPGGQLFSAEIIRNTMAEYTDEHLLYLSDQGKI